MTEKSVFPLNNPPFAEKALAAYLSCPYCIFSTKYQEALARHVSRFHEGAQAQEGERVRERGRDRWERTRQFLLSHGYVECQFWPDLCPGKVNPLMRRVCQHLADCPEQV